MKKIVNLFLLIILIFLVGCSSNDIKNIKTNNQIEINKKQYIEQLKKVNIKGTNDYLTITKKVKWKIPKYEKGTTVSFSIPIHYTITIDGKDYKGIYELNESDFSKDNNPKYNLTVTNLTKNADIEVLIEKK